MTFRYRNNFTNSSRSNRINTHYAKRFHNFDNGPQTLTKVRVLDTETYQTEAALYSGRKGRASTYDKHFVERLDE